MLTASEMRDALVFAREACRRERNGDSKGKDAGGEKAD